MKKSLLTITFVTVLLCLAAGATVVRIEEPGQGDSLEKMIDSLVSLQHQSGEPGGVIAVISDEKILHKGCYGLMNLEQGLIIDEITLFDIASVSKQFTAYAILMLENEGRLNLDDDIREILPWLPAYAHKVTIRHLLQHTSGLPSTDVLRLLAGIPLDTIWTQEDEIRMIKRYPFLNFEPNTTHLYSNAGYSLLAVIIEHVSGLPFPDFMDQKVFKPLGMHASFVMSEEVYLPEHIAVGYRKRQDGFEVFSSLDDLSYGSGNIFSNLHDMILWGQHMQKPVAGNHAFYKRISQPYNTLNHGDSLYYTYGFNVRKYKGMKLVEHSGGVPGFRNQFMVFPEADVIIMLMFNNETINTRPIATGIADHLFVGRQEVDSEVHRQEIDFDLADVQAFEGRYLMPDGMEMTFVAEQDTFWLELPGDMRFQLFAESSHAFFLKAFDAQCVFVQPEDGPVQEIIWQQRGQDYTASRIDGVILLKPEELPSFTGVYHHPELEVDYPITLENGELVLHPPDTFSKYLGIDSITLSHVNGDKFYSGWLGNLQFTRDEYDQINGFVLLDVGRVQHIRFLLTGD